MRTNTLASWLILSLSGCNAITGIEEYQTHGQDSVYDTGSGGPPESSILPDSRGEAGPGNDAGSESLDSNNDTQPTDDAAGDTDDGVDAGTDSGAIGSGETSETSEACVKNHCGGCDPVCNLFDPFAPGETTKQLCSLWPTGKGCWLTKTSGAVGCSYCVDTQSIGCKAC